MQLVITPTGLALIGGKHAVKVSDTHRRPGLPPFCDIHLTVVGEQPHLVIGGCPEELQGPVYQTLTDLDQDSVWFAVAPMAVFDVGASDWHDPAERNRSPLDVLEQGRTSPLSPTRRWYCSTTYTSFPLGQ